jgi:LacI family transcriptional regulator
MLRYSRLHGPFTFLRKHHLVSGGPKRLSLEMLRKWKPHGVILREGSSEIDVGKLGVPMVVAPYSRPWSNAVNILTDDEAIGRAAADHLLDRGFRHFGFYGLGDSYYFSRARRQAFSERIRTAGCVVDVFKEGGNEDLATWVGGLRRPLGLMVCTDDCCSQCYEAAASAGLSIPEDVAVIGVGSDELVCDFVRPSLSSVGLSTEEAGYQAARVLSDIIGGRKGMPNIVVEATGVVVRQSTSVFAVEDAVVASALHFIHEHVGENLHVDDVVKAVPISRRALYVRFRQAVGRSIYEEIRRARMDHAARLLVETTLPIAQVVERLRFTDPKNFARSFQREKGTTPFKYRSRYSHFR